MKVKSEKEKMLEGELYLASDPELTQERLNTRILIQKLNNSSPESIDLRREIFGQLLGKAGKDFWIEPPFYCDYGYNIEAGDQVFFNFNCVVLDVAKVIIGDRSMFGPAVQIYTATHPTDYQIRGSLLEYAKKITIGADVWVGGGSILCPGITIGDRSVIAGGSVVVKDVPEDVMVGGNPAKIIKQLK